MRGSPINKSFTMQIASGQKFELRYYIKISRSHLNELKAERVSGSVSDEV
jgi:hypothetical protein